MSEQILFIIVGAITVATAVMMLLSNNAVHSALFLVTTMGGIAFLFLLLNAPFLAMIQITVYAGAIMVLFLFVIMLLGAETLGYERIAPGGRRWFTPVAWTLGFSLLFAAGLTILTSQVSLESAPTVQPRVRVVNASASPTLDVAANGVTLAEDLEYGDVTNYTPLPTGETLLTVGGSVAVASTNLIENTNVTIVAYGDSLDPQMAILRDDLTALDSRREARYLVFNAYDEPISLIDPGSEFSETDTRVLVDRLQPGQVSDYTVLPEQDVNWEFVTGAENDIRLYTLRDFAFNRDTSTLLVLGEEPLALGDARPNGISVVNRVASSFGAPETIGTLLFTRYLLPFLLLALLLLAAMVGVIVLTHGQVAEESKRTPAMRRRVARPLANVIAAQVGQNAPDLNRGLPSERAGEVGAGTNRPTPPAGATGSISGD